MQVLTTESTNQRNYGIILISQDSTVKMKHFNEDIIIEASYTLIVIVKRETPPIFSFRNYNNSHDSTINKPPTFKV